ncbi:MAG: SDR family oxidoreductase, partial [Deltaproteobacteria bacterium]|nr:SDR family oxidoreductase [Deltaproteobacteria bacterium]
MSKLTSYTGLTALVTGASSGIGRVLSLRLAREGARVVLVARRAPELEKIGHEIAAAGGEALALTCDVSDLASVEKTCDAALTRFGRVDILVNNAGYGHHRRFLEWDVADMERMMRVNYFGTLYFTKCLLPRMVERGAGWIVFMASVAGRIGTPEESAYAATKFAMVGLAEALSIEVEDAGVHVLTVCPGVIRTPFFDAEALERMPPVSRNQFVEPEKLVDAIMKALARGRHELTFPKKLAVAYVVKAVAPEFMRTQVKRTTIDAVA